MATSNSIGSAPNGVSLAEGTSEIHASHEGNQLEADLDAEGITDDEADSAFGGHDMESINTSLKSSMWEYRKENGRTYHSYKDGQYAYPNDEAEKDRLDLCHHLFGLMLDQKLYLAPIGPKPQRVLDIGTGTGIWAIDFADAHPSATVIGTELSPIQPTFVPPNLSFLIEDANENWVYPQKFDYIHARQLFCAVEEKKLFKQAFEYILPFRTASIFHILRRRLTCISNLEPGGYFEILEASWPALCDDNPPPTDFGKWCDLMIEAAGKMGMDYTNPSKYGEWMNEAGFTDVNSFVYKIPTNTWPKGASQKKIGLWSLANAYEGIEGGSMALFTRFLGWSPEQIHGFMEGVKKDLTNKSLRYYWPTYIVYGRKPL